MKSEFKPGDKVRYSQEYIASWDPILKVASVIQDTYTIKKQLTEFSYLADGERYCNKNVILNTWYIEKLED